MVITATDAKDTTKVNSALQATITIKCVKTIDIISGTIASFNYKIDLDAPWTSKTDLPVFRQNPEACTVGTISRELVFTGTGSAPGFISVVTDQVQVATQLSSNVNTYNYKIVATDSLTSVKNEADTFTITVQAPTLADYITLAAMQAHSYKVSQVEKFVDVPAETIYPADADVNLSWAIATSPDASSFVTLVQVSGAWKVRIFTETLSHSGIYTVILTRKESFKPLAPTASFTLTVSCVQTITAPSAFSSTYYISDAAKTIELPDYTLSPSGCHNELTYTAALSPSGTLPTSSVSALTADAALSTINKKKLTV